MKRKTQKLSILLLLLVGSLCQAQEKPEIKKALFNAQLQLLKSSPNYDPETAIASFNTLASQGVGEAMNALGLIYSNGINKPVNQDVAAQWFDKSADAGYLKAWYNAGIMYRDTEPAKAIPYFEKAANAGISIAYAAWGRLVLKGSGVPQDFFLAMSIFKKGAEKGNIYCNYMQGYLLYKGFGCAQNYALAVQQFEIAAQKNYSWAMYMLGLSYRNGYGVAIDTVKAKLWLTKAAALGVKEAQAELDDSLAENANPNQEKTVSKPIQQLISIADTYVPDTFKKVKQTPITGSIDGKYSGILVTYDWSGQNNISSTPLEITLHQNGKDLTGEWKETAGDSTTFSAKIQENNIIFKDSKIDRTEHFYKNKATSFEFREAQLQVLQTNASLFLVGNLQLYNIKELENDKPMYLILEKKQTIVAEEADAISSVLIHPNPIVADFNLSFDLAQAADVTMSIYYLSGEELYTAQWKNLEKGTVTKNLALSAPAGYYLLRLSYGNEVKTTLLIKK